MADRSPKPTELALATYRRVGALWELARNEPDNVGRDLPDDVDRQFCEDHCAALNAYMATPAEDLSALAGKLSLYKSEQLFSGGDCDGEFIGAIGRDVSDLLFQQTTGRMPPRRPERDRGLVEEAPGDRV